jgi:hypothetical protein
MRFSTDGKIWTEWEAFKSSKELTLPAEDGEKTLFVEFNDHAGNISKTYQQNILLDTAAPVIEFKGNQETYSVDSTIAISCIAEDALSGIEASECPAVEGPAYEYKIGVNQIVASAADKAGNTAKAEIKFTVTVDYESLSTLTETFVTKEGVAEALTSKLQAAKAS